jgi:hypothetical protein
MAPPRRFVADQIGALALAGDAASWQTAAHSVDIT